jgi:uncharacterized protein (TIGR02646 family)
VIHVNRPKPPPELAPAAKREWARYQERLAAIRAASRPGSRLQTPKPFEFKVYKLRAVKRALEAAFHHKCAYCEVRYKGAPAPVEHVRPKAVYDWLSADWGNLVPSCTYCNSANHDFIPSENRERSVGKQDAFPLADESRRATRKGQERREYPLLLDPCADDPEPFLAFDDHGQIEPAPALRGRRRDKARTTIDVLGLHRLNYIKSRDEHAGKLLGHLKLCEEFRAELARRPTDAFLRRKLASFWLDVRAFLTPDAEYAAMSRQIVARNTTAKRRREFDRLAAAQSR